ncbi:M48 family metalloprotease [Duganella aceris]|uniref:M48 family metalloprotease n=1 Tax=Duganella aceris TaxID=2703883 RepID=A0ABX0FSK0_9BURK|nr:M48 family metalloprotease [Duganella aceris]NGZ87657.1 M48 family metalloprotease [Duganella aceris]
MAMISTLSRMALAVAMLSPAAIVHAEPPTQELVVARAAILYAERIARLRIDRDDRFTARVRRIAAGLIARAGRDYPDTARWQWEIHTTDDPDQNADCMAGGKILVSQSYVERLGLIDAELAMLLAHEIEHAALQHNLKEYQQALRLDPGWAQRPFIELEDAVDNDRRLMSRLAPSNYEQEQEADREGMLLAWRAGWPAAQLAGYFRKMARESGWPNHAKPDYPSPSSRLRAARAQAATLQKNPVQAAD